MDPDRAEALLARGFYGIPSEATLRGLDFVNLAVAMSDEPPGSPKFLVLERELKRRFAEDQAVVNRRNVMFGALFGIAGTLMGAVVNSFLRSC